MIEISTLPEHTIASIAEDHAPTDCSACASNRATANNCPTASTWPSALYTAIGCVYGREPERVVALIRATFD